MILVTFIISPTAILNQEWGRYVHTFKGHSMRRRQESTMKYIHVTQYLQTCPPISEATDKGICRKRQHNGTYNILVSMLIRHSRLPAGNALWFCQNFFFVFFRRQGFRMITFDRQAAPLQNFKWSHIMVIGRSVLFSDPARPPGGGVGRPKHPKIPPPEK